MYSTCTCRSAPSVPVTLPPLRAAARQGPSPACPSILPAATATACRGAAATAAAAATADTDLERAGAEVGELCAEALEVRTVVVGALVQPDHAVEAAVRLGERGDALGS